MVIEDCHRIFTTDGLLRVWPTGKEYLLSDGFKFQGNNYAEDKRIGLKFSETPTKKVWVLSIEIK